MKIRRILVLLLLCSLLCALLCTVVLGARDVPYIKDEAQVLSEAEERQLEAKLRQISDKHGMDVVAVTVDRLANGTIEATAKDYFQHGGYGYDGIIMMLYFSPGNNRYYFYAQDRAWDLFESRGFDALEKKCVPLLKSGDYAQAIDAFAQTCDGVMSGTIKGGKAPVNLWHILLCLAGGAVLSALIPMKIMEGQLKSVHTQPAANCYIRHGSLNLTTKKDTFLYQHVTKTRRSSGSSGGSRSGGHRGGGRGGSF